MCMIIAVFSFFYAYISYRSDNMLSFYIALSVGLIFIVLMIINIISIKKKRRDISKEN